MVVPTMQLSYNIKIPKKDKEGGGETTIYIALEKPKS